ncbi:2Fe-2S iron-sulfur cluster-binding protein [Aliiroseovarius crassostreae]|uniref:2Fe-2S iron-sulfur cluster-binding protein n=1 Tax=Aliiroseovarius crassostreae TaxID=154981 RepID=UPI003C7DA742
MARFHKLTVTDIHKTIRDAVVVTLTPDDPDSFDFTQGQYLTFRRDFDGQELRRSYSICAGKDDGILQVGIKRVDGGAFSTWANEELTKGDTIEAMPPMGNFHTPIEPGTAKSYLGFAGGSGITPVLSIIKTTLAREPHADFTLVYANKSATTIMFREELEDLKNRYMGRFTVIHVLEADTQEIDLFTGLVDEEKCALLFKQWINIKSIDTAFICGPEPMMLGIAKSLRDHGLTDSQIKFELFASAQPGRAAKKAVSKGASSGTGTEAVINLDGSSRTITMDADTSILDAALAENMDAPYACKAGVCSTCRCKVLEGDVDMIANHALEDYEVEKGYVLSCQAYAKSDKVVVDYDQ